LLKAKPISTMATRSRIAISNTC